MERQSGGNAPVIGANSSDCAQSAQVSERCQCAMNRARGLLNAGPLARRAGQGALDFLASVPEAEKALLEAEAVAGVGVADAQRLLAAQERVEHLYKGAWSLIEGGEWWEAASSPRWQG